MQKTAPPAHPGFALSFIMFLSIWVAAQSLVGLNEAQAESHAAKTSNAYQKAYNDARR